MASRDEWRNIGSVRRLALASLVSVAGSQAATIGLVALVYGETHHSGAWLGATLVVRYAAQLAAAPVAGALGDRFDRRYVMVGSDLAAACAFVLLAFVHGPIAVVVLAGVASICEAPFGPAVNAALGSLASPERRAAVNAMRSAASSVGMLAGASLGGILVAVAGAAPSFLVNALSFLLSGALVASIARPMRPQPSDEHVGALSGFRLIASVPALRTSIATVALAVLAVGMVDVAEYPLFVSLGAGSTAFGIAVAAWGAGQLLGARAARRIATSLDERRGLIRGRFLEAVGIGVAGLVAAPVVVTAAFALGGIGYAIGAISANSIVQRWAPDAVRARVFAASFALQQSAMGISLAVGGVLLGFATPARVCQFAGVLGLAAACLATRMPPRRRSPAPPAEPVAEPPGPDDGPLSLSRLGVSPAR